MTIRAQILCDSCKETISFNLVGELAASRVAKMHDWVQIGLVKQSGYFDYCDSCWPTAKQKLLDKEVQYREL